MRLGRGSSLAATLACCLLSASPAMSQSPETQDAVPVPVPVFESTIRAHPKKAPQEAVEIVDTSTARSEAGNLKSVLDSTKGVVLRQSGGLGSPTTFSLNGLSGNRVRFFIDGVPADIAGFGLSPLDIPLNLIEHVEIYKGVVPIRFGSDALGGAVNFATRDIGETASLETAVEYSSFGTFRGSQIATVPVWRKLHLYVRPQVFFDRANNDYPIDVQVANARGQLVPAVVRRFHDGYQAFGLGAEVGVQNLPWADRLSLRVFHGQNDRDLQSNVFVTVPYGDLTLGDQTTAGILHYVVRDHPDAPFDVDVLLSYADRTGYVTDITRNIWDWQGDVTGSRVIPGERGTGSRVSTHSRPAAGRFNVGLRLDNSSRLEFNVSPAYTDWQQRNQSQATVGLAWVQTNYSLFKLVSGVSWQLRLFGARLRNDLFAKVYYANPHGPVNAIVNNQPLPTPSTNVGGGDSARYSLVGPLFLKASYEYATRVPDAQELFGDGLLIVSSAALKPEKSHNLNLGLSIERWDTLLGELDFEAAFFYRRTRDLIFLVVGQDSAQYQNISDVDTTGFEASTRWTAADTLTLSANVTVLNAVSETTGGYFGRYLGNRIPNQPYLFYNLAASLNFGWVDPQLENVRLYWHAHYVHDYFLFWANDGDPTHKLIIPEQFLNHIGISGSTQDRRITGILEARNVANAKAYDNVGQQLAGRSFHVKLVVGLD